MSDYHVMDGEEDARTYRVVFHIPVPNENNRAGVNLRAALAQDAGVDKTSRVPWIMGAEQTQLTNGELIEIIASYTRKPGNTQVQDRNALDAKYTAMVAAVQQSLRDEYQYWGFDRDVP